jgi:ribosomal protein L7/L12
LSEPFKAFVNKTAFATNGNEVHASLYIDRPVFDENGKVVVVREEQGLIIFSMEYAKAFSKSLLSTVENAQKSDAKKVKKEVEGNGSK